jgi:histidyl-tRNA synthetase
MHRAVKGFRDILPGASESWQTIEKTAQALFEDFGFREIRVPLLEERALFARGIGEATDIVEKEMYTFDDRSGDMLTLRPEATAGICRAYIQHQMAKTEPVQKFYTFGPMFRRERPQKGRYRQFFQIDGEIFGIAAPEADALCIVFLNTLFSRLGVTGLSTHVNSLGCPACRPAYKSALQGFLETQSGLLCGNCLRRKETNPLRVLDCKAQECKEAAQGAPDLFDSLCPECKAHFARVETILGERGIPYIRDPRLVRGLDYYTRTTFEVLTDALGAQNAVAGGGRYDGLVETLGGPPTPATGFAIGLDRLAEVMEAQGKAEIRRPRLFIATMGNAASDRAFGWILDLAEKGIHAEMDYEGKSLKSQMKRADKLNAEFALVVGNEEIEKGEALLKRMDGGGERRIPLADVAAAFLLAL